MRKTDLIMLDTKLTKKVHNPGKAKKHQDLFLKNQGKKVLKRSKTDIQLTKTVEKANIIDIRLVTIE